jgi:hypothetical protein
VSSSEVVQSFLRGEISRRTLIRRLVAAGVSLSAAMAYSELLRPEWAFASHECSAEFYDHYGYYGDCGEHYTVTPPKKDPTENRTPPPPPPPPPPDDNQPGPPPPDTTPPTTGMKVSKLSLATLLLTGRLVVRFTSSEAGSVTFTVTTTVANRSAAAEAARSVVVARGSARFARPGTKRVRLKLTRRGRKLLLKRRRVTLKVRARAVDAAGNARVRVVRLTLR